MSLWHNWTDDCGDIAIFCMAQETYPFIYRSMDTDFDALFLIRDENSSSKYEWWLFDTQFTLEDYLE